MKSKNKLYKEIWNVIRLNKTFLLTSHLNPDGDALSSQLMLAYILNKFKKKYNIVLEENFPERFNFVLKEYYKIVVPELITVPKGIDFLTQLKENYFPEIVFILDCGGTERLGEFSQYFDKAKMIINIDHHPGNRHFKSHLNLIDEFASSTGEIIYDLAKNNNFKIDKNLLQLAYISILTDTRFFTQSNTTEKTHSIAAEAIKAGVKPEQIAYNLQEVSPQILKIFGAVLQRIKTEFNEKVIYSFIKNDELEKCKNGDIDVLIELLRATPNTKVAILFKMLTENKIKVSMRGKNKFNVFRIAYKFGGGGHLQAAGFTLNTNLQEAIKLTLPEIKKYLSD